MKLRSANAALISRAVVVAFFACYAYHAYPASEDAAPAQFTAPKAGTPYKIRATSKSGTLETTYRIVSESAPYRGRAVFGIEDGVGFGLVDLSTGNRIATLDADGKETIVLTPDSGDLSWPLVVGKRWRARYDYEDRLRGRTFSNVQTWWRVEAFEEVSVPAGTFKAFRLQSEPGENNSTRSTVWFSPELGIRIRQIFERTPEHYLGPYREESELVELKSP